MIRGPAVEQDAAVVDPCRLALNPEKAVGHKVKHQVIGMTLTERNQNGQITFHQSSENLGLSRVPLESRGHGLSVRRCSDRTYVRHARPREVLKLARTRP
jgi:hypothetical protein